MPGFGRFETVEEISSRGLIALYAARPAGEDGPPRHAIKVLRMDPVLGDPETFDRQAELFLESARVQKTLVDGGAEGWCRIVDLGKTSDAAYYTADLYALTGQRMIDLRREVDARQIAEMSLSVLSALTELADRVGGRSHGALTNHTILVSDRDGAAGVVLTDPAPEQNLDSSSAASDLRGLGGFIFGLVMHREPPRGGAVARSGEWAALGTGGEALRTICEQLINASPSAMPERASLVRALEALRGGGDESTATVAVGMAGSSSTAGEAVSIAGTTPVAAPAKSKSKAPLIGAIAAIVLVAGGVGAYVAISGGKKQDQTSGTSGGTAQTDPVTPDGASGTTIAQEPPEPEEPPPAPVPTGPEDPRPGMWLNQQTAQLDRLKQRIDAVLPEMRTQEGEQAAAAAEKAGEFERRIGEIFAEFERIKALPWDQTNKDVRDATAAAMTAFDESWRELRRQVMVAENDSRVALSGWVQTQRTALLDGQTSENIRQAIQRTVREIDPELASSPPTWAAARGRLAALRAWDTAVKQGMVVTFTIEAPQGSEIDVAPMQQVFDAARGAALETAAGDLARGGEPPAPDDPRLQASLTQLRDQLNTLGRELTEIRDLAAEMERVAAAGFGYAEVPQGGRSIAQIEQELASPARAQRVGQVAASVQAVRARGSALRALSQQRDAAALRQVLAGGETSPWRASFVRQAWMNLVAQGSTFPATLEELTQAPALVNTTLAQQLAGMSDTQRRDAMLAEARAALPGLWTKFITTAAGDAAANVEGAFGAMQSFGIAEAQIASLPAGVRYNFARWQMARGIEAAIQQQPDPKQQAPVVLPVLDRFLGAVAAIDSSGAGLAALDEVRRLRTMRDRMASGKGTADFREVGPGAQGATPRWDLVRADEDNGEFVVYGWQGPTRRWEVEFRKVPGEGDRTTYMMATEFPVGLFIDLMTATNRWSVVPGLINREASVDSDDNRRGPRTWEWIAGPAMQTARPPRDEEAQRNRTGNGWIRAARNGMDARPYYPATIPAITPPDALTPMNYVSPHAAILAARLMGSRLPTSGEWLAASTAGAGEANRRDATWVAQHQYIDSLFDLPEIGGQIEWPNGDVFRPRGQRAADPRTDATPAVSGNDGVLWFRSAEPGSAGVFRDLVGNVAEWTYEDPARLESLAPDPAAITQALPAQSPVRAIGASALSAEGDPAVAQEVATSAARAGYSDVGFRLAFSVEGGAGGGRPGEAVRRLLAQGSYQRPQ